MRKKGMIVAATLMEKWLKEGANNIPKHAIPDTTTVRMNWALSFGRVASVYRSAKEQKVWLSDLAKKVIIEKLIARKNLWPSVVGERKEIGNVGEDEKLNRGNVHRFHEEWQIQYKGVEERIFSSPLDDLYAALADFHFYYLVKGWVELLEEQNGLPRYRVTINKVGVYLMDEYHFNDDSKESKYVSQILGIWNCSKTQVGKYPTGQGWYLVQNKDFREWRKKYGKGRGGDFSIFSDIKVFDTNDSFEFTGRGHG